MSNNPITGDPAAQALATLDPLGLEYEILECDPNLADTAVFCEHYNIPLSVSANVIVAAGKSDPRQYAACVLLATTRLDVNKSVRKRMGVKKCSFASAEETRDLTGMEIGGGNGCRSARFTAVVGRQPGDATELRNPGWWQPFDQDQSVASNLSLNAKHHHY